MNEKPVKIGLCSGASRASDCHMTSRDDHMTGKDCHVTDGEHMEDLLLCKLDYLRERASSVTSGFATLTELCKDTT